MKANDILIKARYTLSDTDKSRWSDARLLSLLNDALLDIALTTRLYNASGLLKLKQSMAIYDISSYAVKIERVEHLGLPLTKASFTEMDTLFGENWQDEVDKIPTHIVYDLKRAGEFQLYPKPTEGDNDYISATSNFGIVTALNYDDLSYEIIDSYGDIAAPNIAEYLKIYYIRTPKELTSIEDELENVIDRTMLSSLSHYVSGAALRDNMDVKNREVGNEELRFYEGKKQRLIEQKMKGDIRRIRVTEYRGMG